MFLQGRGRYIRFEKQEYAKIQEHGMIKNKIETKVQTAER